jgi:uncharacterized protein (UPF0332 family)
MSFEECLRKGSIKKSDNAKDKVSQSITLGDKFLKSAKKTYEIEEYEVCEIIAYDALFHYARALLYNKGYGERSHACLFIAVEKLYPEIKELTQRADKIRIERHNLQYSGLLTDKESVDFVIELIEEFRTTTNKLITGKE